MLKEGKGSISGNIVEKQEELKRGEFCYLKTIDGKGQENKVSFPFLDIRTGRFIINMSSFAYINIFT